MRFAVLVLVSLLAVGCGPSDREITRAVAEPAETRHPPPELPEVRSLRARPLARPQQKQLDETLPPKVREVLEKADTLEVLGLSSEDRAGIGWYPDVTFKVPVGKKRTELLDAFYFDASAGPNPSACFIPRHGLRATHRGKTVEVIICFQCHLFVVKGDLGEFEGGVYREGSASHKFFEELLSSGRTQPTP